MLTKLSCAIGSGLCVAYFPGSLAWLVPAAVLSGVVVYEATTPPEERAALRALAVSRTRALLPAPAARPGGVIDGLRWFGGLPARDKAAFLLARPGAPEYAPALPAPDSIADDNGDGAAEGDTRKLTPAPATVASAVAAQTPPRRRTGPRTLTAEEFAADPLFAELNAEPHRMIIGHTQGGKSTAMHAMVGAWAAQGAPVYVADPDAARGQWPGATRVAGYNEDYAGIARLLAEVDAIFVDRSEAYAEGERDFEPVHVVLDEVHETFANVPQSKTLVDKWARRGAKRGVLVTLGTQDNHRDSLGLDSAAVLNNFITAELERAQGGRRQARVYRGNAAQQKSQRTLAVPMLPSPREYIRPASPPAPAPVAAPVAAQTPTSAVGTLTLDELARVAPSLARKRGYVPTAEDQTALAAMLGLDDGAPPPAQSVTVERGGQGGDVHVHVSQVSGATATGRRPRTPSTRDRRRRLAYIEAARRGEKFEPTYRRLRGSRNEMWALFTEHKPK